MEFLSQKGKLFQFDPFCSNSSYNHVVFGLAGAGMSLNPFRDMKADIDSVMRFLVLIHGGAVAESVQTKAKEVALAVAATKADVNLITLIDAFEQVDELKEFADELQKAALPGDYAKFFD